MIIKDYIHVANVKCAGCVETITDALVRLDGVERVMVDQALGTVDLEYEEGLRQTVVNKLSELGYPEMTEHDLLARADS